MKILVTAGNTQAPIDKVRCLTNIFTGRTGARIACHAHERGHAVELCTSHPETVANFASATDRWSVLPYRTFEDLHALMMNRVKSGGFDAIVHCAAVSDYLSAGVFSPAKGTRFESDARWTSDADTSPKLEDRAALKVKSDEPELWIRLIRAPKLVDKIRPDWGFRGILAKFKLEVGISEARLIEIAERSRQHSLADLMAANTLEDANSWAFLGPLQGRYERIERAELAPRLVQEIERLAANRNVNV